MCSIFKGEGQIHGDSGGCARSASHEVDRVWFGGREREVIFPVTEDAMPYSFRAHGLILVWVVIDLDGRCCIGKWHDNDLACPATSDGRKLCLSINM